VIRDLYSSTCQIVDLLDELLKRQKMEDSIIVAVGIWIRALVADVNLFS